MGRVAVAWPGGLSAIGVVDSSPSSLEVRTALLEADVSAHGAVALTYRVAYADEEARHGPVMLRLSVLFGCDGAAPVPLALMLSPPPPPVPVLTAPVVESAVLHCLQWRGAWLQRHQ